MLNLIPQPKKIIEKQGSIDKKSIFIKSKDIDARLYNVLRKLPLSDDGISLEINYGDKDSEAYILNLTSDGIFLNAEGIKGAFYGIQTLRQIFTNDTVPCCCIEDKPDFKYRGFYHDITRGRVPSLATLKLLVDEIAYYKMNSLQLYVEHTYAFKEYEDSIDRTGYITAEEIEELDKYCRDNFIDFIPSLSTFGHLFELLDKDKYKHLCEIEDYQSNRIFWIDRMDHHTIDPTNPESIELIKGMIDQYLPLFSSEYFNICCDETFDLSRGRHKDIDTSKLYLEFVTKIIEHVNKKGKKVMMWGDILLKNPDSLAILPKDTIVLNWGYEPVPDKNKIKACADMGVTQIVCPGTDTWNKLCEGINRSIPNITNMSEYGAEYGAAGVLNTNWGDYGNPCSIRLAECGLAFGAGRSWNVDSDTDKFFESIDTVAYQYNGAAAHVRSLNEIQDNISWQQFVYCYSNVLFKSDININIPDKNTITEAVEGCNKLIAQLEKEQWGRDTFRTDLIIAAEGIKIIAEYFLKYKGYTSEIETDVNAWLKKYRKAWTRDNKESELREIEKLFLTLCY